MKNSKSTQSNVRLSPKEDQIVQEAEDKLELPRAVLIRESLLAFCNAAKQQGYQIPWPINFKGTFESREEVAK